jgi:hypothetical protein
MAKRAGRTVKLSISLDRSDVEHLKKRAKHGNLSAAIAEMIRIAREWEGREALAEWLRNGRDEPTEEAMEAVRAEWRGTRPRKRRTKAA